MNLGVALYSDGGLENLLKANRCLTSSRAYYRARKAELSRDRAHVDWATGAIRFELRRYPEGRKVVGQRPAHLRAVMHRALRDFLALGMAVEATAVASDLARVSWRKRDVVASIVDDTLSSIESRWSTLCEDVRARFPPMGRAMIRLRDLARRDVVGISAGEHDRRIQGAIDELRSTCDAAHVAIPPCLIEAW